jgi:soluble lytic murein transglycosylase-like protein
MGRLLPMRTFYLGLCTIVLLSFSSRSAGQAIVSMEENGRRVWTNEGTPEQAQPTAAPRTTRIVYWSRMEHRWKPVPLANSAEMRSAQSVIAEVRQSLAARPQRAGAVHVAANAATPAEVDTAIEQAAARHSVDPNLVRAVIKVESNFNPQAVSRKGAVGLMQLMPSTARGLNVTNPFDPQQNVEAGVRHLRSLLDNYSGDLPRTLAAYNAGQGAVDRHRGVPPYAETRDYVRRITGLYGSGAVAGHSPVHTPMHITRGANGAVSASNVE